MAARTLLEHLRTRDDAALGELLRERPDLALPAPADTGVVATRAGVRSSVARVCETLDALALAVVDALLVHRADEGPVPGDDVLALLGSAVPAERGRQALRRLEDLALVWPADDQGHLRALPALREVAGRHPGGLGRPAPELSAVAVADDPAALVAERPADERTVLETLATDGPVGRSQARGAEDGPVGRLLADGLLVRVDAETVELPRELGLALRGDAPLGEVAARDPMPPPREVGEGVVDATAAGEALEVLRRAETLLDAWGSTPPAVLRSGGLGVRDLRRAARELGLDEAGAALLVEVLVAAGLLAASEDAPAVWAPTTTVDRWLAGAPETRWVSLAQAWTDMPRMPSLVGGRDLADKLVGPLSDEVRRPWAPAVRRRVLDRLAELPAGTAAASADDLVASLAWRAPRQGGRSRDTLVRTLLGEATALGLVALDGLTSAARELLVPATRPGDDPARAAAGALRAALPAPVDHVLLQADLTAVAPGRLEPELAAAMEQVADVESAGGATVYRIGERSLRRALDLGRTAADLHELFATRSATPVPQGLTYLVDDVARRHGRLRGGTAASFLRTDDEALVAEVLARPEAEALELRRVAPTVLVSARPLSEVLDTLRAAGLAPSPEQGEAAALGGGPRGRRVPPRRPDRGGVTATTLSSAPVGALVAQLRAGDRVADDRRAGRATGGTGDAAARYTASATVATLSDAARAGSDVWIGYVDQSGTVRRRVVTPRHVGGGVLAGLEHPPEGSDDGAAAVRLPLHRITSVSVLAEH